MRSRNRYGKPLDQRAFGALSSATLGHMDRADIEGTAELLYRQAGFDSRHPVPAVALARATLGPGSVFSVHARSLPGDAALVRVDGAPRIYVRAKLDRARRQFAIMHELAEYHLERIGYLGGDIEECADALAAALLVPRQCFLSAVREDGVSFPILARRFQTSESYVALRLGEATGEPLALIARRIRVRGDEWAWPNERELRRALRGQIPGVRKVALEDDPRRLVLRVQGNGE